LSIEHLL